MRERIDRLDKEKMQTEDPAIMSQIQNKSTMQNPEANLQ